MSIRNLLLNTDSYKMSHYKQYPKGTEYVSSYVESRGGRWNRVRFFGLQMFLMDYLCNPITRENIDEAAEIAKLHGVPFNQDGWEHILNVHGGYLPLSIEAAPEGMIIETGNVLVQVVNSDPRCFWLTSYIETALLRAVWYPTTVCTNSWMCKQIILDSLNKTADDPQSEIMFKLHDFGFRGVSSLESGAIGGCAHLVNFMGSDTLGGILAARHYYGEPMAGFSIPASEHSTITSWGQDREYEAYQNMIEQFGGPNKIFACVSDSYDIYNAVDNIWPSLKDKLERIGGTLVIRPDSGNPVAVVSSIIEHLLGSFGFSINTKGYKVLPPNIRVIQGDGVDEKTIKAILQELEFRKISASNVAFGMGGALLQHLERDTLRFAMKCSAARIQGRWIDVFKDPITDPNKKSKRGILSLTKDGDKFVTKRRDELQNRDNDYLDVVYHNGELIRYQSFAQIRAFDK